jgi:hypothetical protein
MSGAELIAVIGVAASVIQIFESCAKIVKVIRNCKPKHECLENLEPQICLLVHDIKGLRSLDLNSPPHNALAGVLAGCKRQIMQLLALVQEYQKGSDISRSKRMLQTLRARKLEKEIQKVWTIICEYKLTIILHLSIHATLKPLVGLDTSADEVVLFNMPFSRNPNLVGRQTVFDTIFHAMNNCDTQPYVLSLVGMAGIGKTQIAIELCYRVRHQYSVVVWIQNWNNARITKDIIEFASALSRGERTFTSREESLIFLRTLAKKRTRPWLLIFEDCESKEALPSLCSVVTDGRQRDVVLTTQRVGTSWGVQIEISPMSEEDAVQLLLRNSLLASTQDELNAAKEVSREVGGLPLALTTIGGIANMRGISIREFLGMYKKCRADFSPYERTSPRTTCFD